MVLGEIKTLEIVTYVLSLSVKTVTHVQVPLNVLAVLETSLYTVEFV